MFRSLLWDRGSTLFGCFEGIKDLRQGDRISALLFVMCMEYMTRTSKVVGEKPEFKFYPRCTDVKLNHLYFVDDVILCSKCDFVLVYTLLMGFERFLRLQYLMLMIKNLRCILLV